MPSLLDAVGSIVSQPTSKGLVELRGVLLTGGYQGKAVDSALDVAEHFYGFLSELQSKMTARRYSELASLMDIGAVGAVALENVVDSKRDEFWRQLALGGIAEGLMVGASRQYVKGWKAEATSVISHAVWYLSGALWHASSEMQPELDSEERWKAIQALLAPASDDDVPEPDKAVLLGRVFQMLLITHLARLLGEA
jgi:hypothetical protein